jgi:hypothetical protein
MDTLVYTVSTFIVPINIAAVNGKYDLMNIFIFLTLTSWAHHGITHELSCIRRNSCSTLYNRIDKYMCYIATAYTILYAVFFTIRLQCLLYFACLASVLYTSEQVENNKFYYKRGIQNWKHHTSHVVMHMSTCVGFIIISLKV